MSRRARPTLRVLREDLGDGWPSPFTRRAIEAGDIEAIQPLDALDHPILLKASSSFTDNPADDTYVGSIASVSSSQLLEIKSGQWRAGVLVESDVCWVVTAGLAKGGHKDRDDFYKSLERQEENGTISALLPSQEDRDALKRERASAIIEDWQLQVQNLLLDAVRTVAHGGVAEISIPSPDPKAESGELFASMTMEVALPEDDYPHEDVVLEFSFADRWKNTQLRWHLTVQALATVNPPQDGWYPTGEVYSNLLEPGTLARRALEVEALHDRGEIARSTPTSHSHWTHRKNLAQRSIDGTAVLALCGIYFVPHRDAGAFDKCPTCASLYSEIPTD
ncbi:DUF3039 domain-containing protein [Brachybacterium paraconglomeratum]|uniref:DUF3039 domain-containing protein n=1 Tax=Brachybacterium paraconglomeratum TaxID=173362 RepID=UPI00223AEDEB|nr:DUF3039 domain-containing protein [Brachybacterium paraconglomeratum]MCT1435959.1 DUF3039 domain-containing protein [Brachybacterium paraconglomeratum]